MTFEQWWEQQPIAKISAPHMTLIVKSFEEIARQAWIAGAASVPPVAIAPELHPDEEVVINIDYYDIDEMVTEFLREKGFHNQNFDKHGYECVAYEEWSNYEEHSFDVVADTTDILELGDRLHYKLGDILNWMCAEGKLRAGTYLIKVFW